MAPATLIGIDVGTTAVKAVLMDENGRSRDRFVMPYPIHHPEAGRAEQDPADWMRGVTGALEAFAASTDLSNLRGVGITSQVNTHVFVDANGDPLLPAIVWQDGRCAEDAATLESRTSPEEKTKWFGGPVPIDASHALSRMAHVARVHPDVFEKTRHVLLPKDYCILELTGEVVADPLSAVGLVDSTHNYVPPLLDLLPGAADRLPPLSDFDAPAGTIREGFPGAGAPVVVGTMDAWASMFGAGVLRDGQAMYLSGTSEVPGIVSATTQPTPGVILFPPYKGITAHMAPTQSGGASLAWFGETMGTAPEQVSDLVAATEPGGDIPLFLPHLQGERAPLWDTESRGVFARLTAATGRNEMARAVMEGVAFSARLAFEALFRSAGRTPDTINIGGGGARSGIWCQIRADALGIPLNRVAVPDVGPVGAAILAGLGSGTMAALDEAVDRLVTIADKFEPDANLRTYYDHKFDKYRELYEALGPFNQGYGSP